MMKTNGQSYCPCITGVNLAGVRFGDDYSAQATEDKLKKLHTKFVAIQLEKERRWQVEEFSMRDSIKKWANTEKQRVRREAMQGWQAMKGAAALSGDAVTTTATTTKSALAAVEEEDESYIEEVEEEDSDQVDDDGTG